MVGREGKAAAACQADPIYVWLGEIFGAAGALGSGRTEEARHLIEQCRVEPANHGYGALTQNYRAMAAIADVGAGHVIRGFRELMTVRASMEAAGDITGCASIDMNVARAYVALARGDLPVSKVKNPGLMMLLPTAAKKGRTALDRLLVETEESFPALRPAIEFELARLAAHRRKPNEARAHLDAVDQLLSAEPYAYLRTQVAKERAEL